PPICVSQGPFTRLMRRTSKGSPLKAQVEGLLAALGAAAGEHAGRLRALLGVPEGRGLECCAWVRIERQGRSYDVRLEQQQLAVRCSLLLHEYVDTVAARLPALAEERAAALPAAALVEDCDEERFGLLERLQRLRLARARLREAFQEDASQLE
ncbi:unnamed protein product, partial [Prorocentrum cordatum]